MDLNVGGRDSRPVHVEVTTTPTKSDKPAEEKADRTFSGLAAWLAGGFVVLTGLLTAVGSYTGGVARMVRNDPTEAILVFVGVFVAVVLGVVAGEVAKAGAGEKWGAHLWLMLAGLIVFFVSLVVALRIAVESSAREDRPSLNAQLVASDLRMWSVKGTAGTSGLRTDERLQVLVYGVLPDSDDAIRLFFSTAGPNSDGVASESFEVPLPTDVDFEAIVVTANTGNLPRDCSGGRAFYAESNVVDLTVAPPDKFEKEWQNACVTLAPPPEISED
jgi:hypothetical protein